MGSSTSTANLHLSQFGPNDKPAWQGDYNNDMLKIDADSATQLGQLNSLQTQINALATRVTALETTINTAVTGVLARLHALDGK